MSTIALPQYTSAIESGDIHIKFEPKLNLIAIIAIHNTNLGPSLGGCRFVSYPSLNLAIADATRLARGMSYKAAMANLPLGGGKSVIIRPNEIIDRQAMFETFGKFVNELSGRYITAVDSGTDLDDMEAAGKHTRFVSSLKRDGNPSPKTSQGILRGIQAAAKHRLNRDELQGLHVAIQGVGHVGFILAELLHEAGVKLTVADINADSAEHCREAFKASVVSTQEIHRVKCDLYAPCALGGAINESTLPELNCQIVAGGANNQLATPEMGDALRQRGILYAPDYVINAGGVIHCAERFCSPETFKHSEKIDEIYNTLMAIFERADAEQKSPAMIADKIARERIDSVNGRSRESAACCS